MWTTTMTRKEAVAHDQHTMSMVYEGRRMRPKLLNSITELHTSSNKRRGTAIYDDDKKKNHFWEEGLNVVAMEIYM